MPKKLVSFPKDMTFIRLSAFLISHLHQDPLRNNAAFLCEYLWHLAIFAHGGPARGLKNASAAQEYALSIKRSVHAWLAQHKLAKLETQVYASMVAELACTMQKRIVRASVLRF